MRDSKDLDVASLGRRQVYFRVGQLLPLLHPVAAAAAATCARPRRLSHRCPGIIDPAKVLNGVLSAGG